MVDVLAVILILVLASATTVLFCLTGRFRFKGSACPYDLAGWVDRLKCTYSTVCSGFLVHANQFGRRVLTCADKSGRLICGFALVVLARAQVLRELASRIELPKRLGRFNRPGLVGHINLPFLQKAGSGRPAGSCVRPDLDILNCRVRLTSQPNLHDGCDFFAVEICGSIQAPEDMYLAALRVSIADVTGGVRNAEPVYSRLKEWQAAGSRLFCFTADLGKLPHRATLLEEWTTVAQLPLEWLAFPRKGERNLRFNVSVLSRQYGRELASAECNCDFENSGFGYIDSQENIQRTKVLAVGLAFAVSAVDNKLFNCEVELIKNWARDNVSLPQATANAERKLEKALNKTISFFCEGNKINAHQVCREIAEIAPVADRYDILDLCLHVAQKKGSAAAEEVAFLNSLALWLGVDMNRFRGMMEKVLPVGIHQVTDTEALLGITSDMSREKARQHLNREYSKWNSRVTNSDPEVRTQADQMLKLIAEARTQYVGQDASR